MSENGEIDGAGLEDTHPMEPDHEACYRALSTRDARFDGRFIRRWISIEHLGRFGHPGLSVGILWPMTGPIIVRGPKPGDVLAIDCCPLSEWADTQPKPGGQQLH